MNSRYSEKKSFPEKKLHFLAGVLDNDALPRERKNLDFSSSSYDANPRKNSLL